MKGGGKFPFPYLKVSNFLFGTLDGIRTHIISIKSRVHSPLCYKRMWWMERDLNSRTLMGIGLQPTAFDRLAIHPFYIFIILDSFLFVKYFFKDFFVSTEEKLG